MSEPAEGWYADPSGAGQLRWWDGHAWTEYVESYEGQTPANEPRIPDAGEPAASSRVEAHPGFDQERVSTHDPAREASASAVADPTPEGTSPWDTITASVLTGANAEETESAEEAPKRSGVLKWALGCAASWMLVAVFIAVLVVAWSHLGPSGRIHEDAKRRAETARSELDAAQSTLDDINRQIEEAQK